MAKLKEGITVFHPLEEIIGARIFLISIHNAAVRIRKSNTLTDEEKQTIIALHDRWVELANDFQDRRRRTWSKNHAYEFMRNAYLIGLFAVPEPGEIKKIMKIASSAGGRSSGKTRAKKAEDTWHPYALALALKSRKEDQTLSQDDVATYILDNWGHPKPKIFKPGHSSLKRFISQKIKSGELPDKVR